MKVEATRREQSSTVDRRTFSSPTVQVNQNCVEKLIRFSPFGDSFSCCCLKKLQPAVRAQLAGHHGNGKSESEGKMRVRVQAG